MVWLFYRKKNKTKQINKWHTWLKFCLPTKLLTKFEVVATKSSGPFCRQPQSDNGRFHQQTNLLTVFGPCGFNWQLVRLTSACKEEHFSKQAKPREGDVKIFAPFCSKLFPRKINKQGFKHNKNGIQEGRRHLRLVLTLMLKNKRHARSTSYNKYKFVRLLTFIFNMPSKINQLSCARKTFAL